MTREGRSGAPAGVPRQAPPVNETTIHEKVCMITGATNGIGKAAAMGLARLGARLVIVGRDRERGERTRSEIAARTGNRQVELLLADFSSQRQVRRLAGEFLASGRPLHVLLNNAGVVNLRREETEDGIETTFAVNHLAHFLLTRLLLDRLRASAPARIVSTASGAYAYARGPLDFDDLDSRRRYSMMHVYGKSKLANILFTQELARRLAPTEVTANCFHPGFVGSNFARNNGVLASIVMPLLRPLARTNEQGAETAVYLCAAPDVEGVTGQYFYDCRPKHVKPWARSEPDAKRLWQESERLVGLGA